MDDYDEDETPSPSDELVEKIHEIQEEIFDREDQIDELIDGADEQEQLLDVVEAGRVYRRRMHLKRLKADWEKMVEHSREESEDHDFELAAALVHFVGDILISQSEGTDLQWIARLRQYIQDRSLQVN